jgi:hypothetical protein
MIYIKMNGNEIGIISYVKPKNTAEWIAVAEMPPKPITEDDTEPRLMLVDGALVWQVGKTAEEIAEERKKAYTEECDPYLVAYQGYLVEGDTAKAESARKAYLRAKAEVRKRLPYNV